MKIATYNVNGVNGRLPVLLRWLEEAQPDIVCLQELKAPQEKFPLEAITEAGYNAIWHGQKSWNGVAILSRIGEPVVTRRRLTGNATDPQARYIEAAVNGRGVALAKRTLAQAERTLAAARSAARMRATEYSRPARSPDSSDLRCHSMRAATSARSAQPPMGIRPNVPASRMRCMSIVRYTAWPERA